MIVKDNIPNKCYPIDVCADITRLNISVDQLLLELGLSQSYFERRSAETLNISHLPNLVGDDRWKLYRGDHLTIQSEKQSEENFTKFLSELNGTYLKQIIDEVYEYHIDMFGSPFSGRCQLIASKPGHTYAFHRDMHTKHRYHIPLKTNEDVIWLFKQKKEIDIVHMPADGRIWYLDPINISHTFVNASPITRLHVLLTSEK